MFTYLKVYTFFFSIEIIMVGGALESQNAELGDSNGVVPSPARLWRAGSRTSMWGMLATPGPWVLLVYLTSNTLGREVPFTRPPNTT